MCRYRNIRLRYLARRFNRMEKIMSDNTAAIEAVVAQLAKVQTEIVGKIDALQTAVDAGEDLTGPLAALTAAAQALDDIVPDVAEVPDPEVPVEPPVDQA